MEIKAPTQQKDRTGHRPSLRKQLSAVWQRHKSGVIRGAALATLIYTGITVMLNLSAQMLLAGTTVNVHLTEEGSTYLEDAVHAQLETEDVRGKILLADAELEAFETLQDLDVNYDALQGLLALYETQELDFMLMDQIAMENFLRQETYLDLEIFFTAEELAALGDMVVYAKPDGEAEPRPVVLDVTALPFIRDHATASGKIYFALMNNTLRLKACRILWNVMYSWEAGEV